MSSPAGGAGGIPRGVVSVDRRSVGPRARRSSRERRPAGGPVRNPLALRFTEGASGRPSPERSPGRTRAYRGDDRNPRFPLGKPSPPENVASVAAFTAFYETVAR